MTMLEIMSRPQTDQLNKDRARRILSMAYAIPQKSTVYSRLITHFLEHVLGIDYRDHRDLHRTKSGKKAVKSMERQKSQGQLKITGREEPIEKFLIKAIAKGKSWEQLIEENKITKLFNIPEYARQPRQYLIIYICRLHYPLKTAMFLIFKILQRSRYKSNILIKSLQSCPYYANKVQQLIDKSQEELQMIDDERLKRLLMSIKKKHNMTETLNNQPVVSSIERDCQNLWLSFLSFEASRQTQIIMVMINRQLMWKKKLIFFNQNTQLVIYLKKRLKKVLTRKNFRNHFYDEAEVILLEGIHQNIEWFAIKERINLLFSYKQTNQQHAFCNYQHQNANISLERNQSVETRIKREQSQEEQTYIEISTSKSRSIYKDLYQSQYLQQQVKPKKSIAQSVDTIFNLNHEQQNIHSLLQKSQDCLKQIQIECSKLPSSSMQLYQKVKQEDIVSPPVEEDKQHIYILKLQSFRKTSNDIITIKEPEISFILRCSLNKTKERSKQIAVQSLQHKPEWSFALKDSKKEKKTTENLVKNDDN